MIRIICKLQEGNVLELVLFCVQMILEKTVVRFTRCCAGERGFGSCDNSNLGRLGHGIFWISAVTGGLDDHLSRLTVDAQNLEDIPIKESFPYEQLFAAPQNKISCA